MKNPVLFARLAHTADVLEERFGIPRWTPKDPLDELIVTILSQNTNDRNRDHAYHRLRGAFPTWEAVLSAPQPAVEEAIRPAGLSKQKSVRIQQALSWINGEYGSLTLEALRDKPDDEIIALLTTLKGVGVKTAAVLAAFSLGRDLCPVDTHVHRISIRLGWVPAKSSADETFALLRPNVPQGRAPTFHLNLLKFGRTVCTARAPNCGGCPFYQECEWQDKVKYR